MKPVTLYTLNTKVINVGVDQDFIDEYHYDQDGLHRNDSHIQKEVYPIQEFITYKYPEVIRRCNFNEQCHEVTSEQYIAIPPKLEKLLCAKYTTTINEIQNKNRDLTIQYLASQDKVDELQQQIKSFWQKSFISRLIYSLFAKPKM